MSWNKKWLFKRCSVWLWLGRLRVCASSMASCCYFSGKIILSDSINTSFPEMVISFIIGWSFRNLLEIFDNSDRIGLSLIDAALGALYLLFITGLVCSMHSELCRFSVSLCFSSGNEVSGLPCLAIWSYLFYIPFRYVTG